MPELRPPDETEYRYGGQAHVPYPEDPHALSDEEWARYLFYRRNPKGLFAERWVHSAGAASGSTCSATPSAIASRPSTGPVNPVPTCPDQTP